MLEDCIEHGLIPGYCIFVGKIGILKTKKGAGTFPGIRRAGSLSKMKILVACEESQAVTIELRKLGHEAYSCDIEPCSGGHPEWHLQVDALELLKIRWDMIIAFPPCTYLSNAGAKHLFRGGKLNQERYEKGWKQKHFSLISIMLTALK